MLARKWKSRDHCRPASSTCGMKSEFEKGGAVALKIMPKYKIVANTTANYDDMAHDHSLIE
jgi:hypothetical protein